MPAFEPEQAFSMIPAARSHQDAICAASLRTPAVLKTQLERFAASFPGADHRVLVSFWSQFYFGGLIPPAIRFIAEQRICPSLRLDAVSVLFCRRKGLPLSFHAADGAVPLDPSAGMTELVDEHLAPIVSILRRQTGSSKRLLWANAGWYLAGTLGQCPDGCRDKVRRALVAALERHGALGVSGVDQSNGPCRRVCCLRYRIPGCARCPGTCPLEQAEPPGD